MELKEDVFTKDDNQSNLEVPEERLQFLLNSLTEKYGVDPLFKELVDDIKILLKQNAHNETEVKKLKEHKEKLIDMLADKQIKK